jgi:hypothetical protein
LEGRDTLKFGEFNAIHLGDDVVVTLRDGKVLSGQFIKFDTLTPSEYANNYNACRVGAGAELPLLGDSVTLFLRGNPNEPPRVIGGELVGFDANVVVLRRQQESIVRRTHIFETVKDSHGHVIYQDTFGRLMKEGHVAMMTAMLVESGNGHERIPMERVWQVDKKAFSNTEKYVVIGVAAVVGAAIIIWVISEHNSNVHSSSFLKLEAK